MVEKKTLLIRADATPEMGSGHVMRCLALAQAWKRIGGKSLFVSAAVPDMLADRLRNSGIALKRISVEYGSETDSAVTSATASVEHAAWIVIDGYQFTSRYYQLVKGCGCRVLVMDDVCHTDRYDVDAILNQNPYASEEVYRSRGSDAPLFLGTRYVLLREEFLNHAHYRSRKAGVAAHILVTMGGTDPWNMTAKVVTALRSLRGMEPECVIVLAGDHPQYERIRGMASDVSFPVTVESNVSNMADLMAWADMAVSAAGSTVWELLYMGIPFIVVVMADNQLQSAGYLANRGIAINLGRHDEVAPEEVACALQRLLAQPALGESMAHNGRMLVDGYGADRIAMYLSGNRIRLRKACKDDERLLWEWANDAEVRSVSFTSDPIPWEDHVRWFDLKMQDPGCIIYIAVNPEDAAIGQIRYDLEEKDAVVSISIDGQYRGKGYGRDMLELSAERIFEERNVERIHAYIKTDNEASNRVFAKSGYEYYRQETICGFQANHFVKERKISNESVD